MHEVHGGSDSGCYQGATNWRFRGSRSCDGVSDAARI